MVEHNSAMFLAFVTLQVLNAAYSKLKKFEKVDITWVISKYAQFTYHKSF